MLGAILISIYCI